MAPFLKLTNLLIFIIIFFIIFRNFFSNKYLKFSRNLIILLFLFICLVPVGNIGINYLEKNYITQTPLIVADNIIVLAGSESIQSTKITKKLNLNSGSERLISSVKLANRYKNSKIYFLGGDGNLIKNSIDETFVAKQFYKDIDFDLTRVYFLNNTRNTYENLNEFKKLNKVKDQKNVLITSAFHMKRSLLIASKLKLDLIPYAVDYRATKFYSVVNYYQKFSISKNLSSFDIFFREILGILAIHLFY